MRSLAVARILLGAALVLPVAAQAGFEQAGPAPASRAPGIALGTSPANPFTREPSRRQPRGADTRSTRHGGGGVDLRDVYDSIDRRRKNGEISKREARALRREASQLNARAEIYAYGGISGEERRELDVRTASLLYRAQTPIRRQ